MNTSHFIPTEKRARVSSLFYSNQSPIQSGSCSQFYQEKIRGQRGTLPVQALGYVKFGKVIFRRPFATEV